MLKVTDLSAGDEKLQNYRHLLADNSVILKKRSIDFKRNPLPGAVTDLSAWTGARRVHLTGASGSRR